MNSKFFCNHHAQQIKACEAEAIRSWSQMMRRGMRAFDECRVEAAFIYLGSALDIALIRMSCDKNRYFGELHLIRPTEALIQLHLLANEFDNALALLSHVSSAGGSNEVVHCRAVVDFLVAQYGLVERAEKAFYSDWPTSGTNSQMGDRNQTYMKLAH